MSPPAVSSYHKQSIENRFANRINSLSLCKSAFEYWYHTFKSHNLLRRNMASLYNSNRYDNAITVFSPDGRLFQVEYAQEAVKKGSTVVGIKGKDLVAFVVEKKAIPQLQEERTVRKIALIDDHVVLTFAGLYADARNLMNRARIECQSHKLTVEDPCTIEYITRFLAEIKQHYTHHNGLRPFGLSTLIGGFDPDGTARLFQTDPSGTYHEWKACTIGRRSKTVLEYLEKHYFDGSKETEKDLIIMALKSLFQVLPAGSQNVEVAIMRRGQPMAMLSTSELEEYIAEIEELAAI